MIISEVSREKSHKKKTFIFSGSESLRQSLLSALMYNKTTIIQLHFCQIWNRILILYGYWSLSKTTGRGKVCLYLQINFEMVVFDDRSWNLVVNINDRSKL